MRRRAEAAAHAKGVVSGYSSETLAESRGAQGKSKGRAGVGLSGDMRADLELWTLGNKHAALFPEPGSLRASLKALRDDLAEVEVMGDAGKVVDVHEKISRDKVLSKLQKDRVFKVLAEVRDSYLRIDGALRHDAPNKGYQVVNWKHTRAEIDQVLEAARLAKLSASDTEDAILASIFSDAVKTPQNFIVHNIDGAAAAALVLARYFDLSKEANRVRLHGIWRSAKEHQIGPPLFMANISKAMLARKLGDKAEAPVLGSIHAKIAKPFDTKHLVADGSELAFSDAERAALSALDIHDWAVPYAAAAHYRVSRAVIDGDSLINYASPDGWAKIAALRGPDTQPFFEDATVLDSLQSAKASYDDAMTVVSDPAKPLMAAGLVRTKNAIKRVRDEMQAWLTSHGPFLPANSNGTIAFWNAPLKYPSKGKLTQREEMQFKFAKQIREKVVELLRAQQGSY
jgi:hypothetical protein